MPTEIFNKVKDIIISRNLNSNHRVEESSHLVRDLQMDSAFQIELALTSKKTFKLK